MWLAPPRELAYNDVGMRPLSPGPIRIAALALASALAAGGQQPPASKGARILLLPRKMVSGDRTTLAVLDLSGRLTPGVTVAFSNGDRVTTDATGRAAFVAPLTQGVLYASIVGRPGRVQTQVVPPSATRAATQVERAPHFASLSDRFDLQGQGFCGVADRNAVEINGRPALVMAASSESLVVLPPAELDPGPGDVSVSCSKGTPGRTRITFLALSLEADTSPLAAGQKRTLAVRVTGTREKAVLEARNLAPEVADLEGGNPARATSSGGADNVARF